MRSVLITGFDPFGGEAKNGGWEALRLLASNAHRPLVRVELPTSFERAPARLVELVREHRPAVVIGVGQGGDEDVIAIETRFVNVIDARIADNDGAKPMNARVVEDGPEAIEATWDGARIVDSLQRAGYAARLSTDAGRFVCNAFGYGLAALARASNPPLLAGFVHVPRLHGLDDAKAAIRIDETRRALEAVLACALVQADERPLG